MSETRIRHGKEQNKNIQRAVYEEWLRMVADNKINQKNSWSFGLIDYLYDLSMKPIDNFQRASVILDGCIKIYSSRVDSAATETGTLLSGLSTNFSFEPIVEETAELITEERPLISRKRNVRRESTLVKSFQEIKVKAIETQLMIDPIFKKTLSYFDEGGAKSLLLNILTTDSSGRVIFDSAYPGTNEQVNGNNSYICLNKISMMLIKGRPLESLGICHSIKALKDLIHREDQEVISIPSSDLLYEFSGDEEGYSDNEVCDDNISIEVGLDVQGIPDYELMDYFNNTIKFGATGKESWKVQKYKQNKAHNRVQVSSPKPNRSDLIDFRAYRSFEEEAAFEDEIFQTSSAKISIPVMHRNKGNFSNNHCLIVDEKIDAKNLIELFTKKTRLLPTFNKISPVQLQQKPHENNEEAYTDAYFDEPSRLLNEITREDIEDLHKSYIEEFSQPLSSQISSNLISKLNYEKISKRIDIRHIKDLIMGNLDNGKSFRELTENIPRNLNGSTSVYFICLLHLCNECNLTLEKVSMEDLKIYKNT
ncbi:hypothetical protein PSN45_004467 [Yamadazyma tenuis]|uniref:Condensin complex subunit 2 n=1 Tax=Candida tenuis (strain ATCC 10573 / BCRC 21748 / CBS 615 / JCM 9827 / NBRC 10315 / NRRL Y-1498 / VKM Y-70) TaxID=590646 RepID=G3B5M2_CANTC|nr:uncharacterized protein CANTEDRAFT_135088 [Yamadazyma tenuis ATCC 10573]EGV63261.1 hypothetical protein CANTEDRAFT_135088 [Yamadazyma tenuis ATCC 10573]WEJ96922.1 hypothetical protein PSN45_004467 [Yamadazyma tenuis]